MSKPKTRKPQEGDQCPCEDCGKPMTYLAKYGAWQMSCGCTGCDDDDDWIDDWEDDDYEDDCDL